MKMVFKTFASYLLKIYFGKNITIKKYIGTNFFLAYEKSQHLMFALKKNISYESLLQSTIKNYCVGANLIFDVGGNIGQYALLFSEWIDNNGKVISIEPDSKNYSFLQFNVNINNINNVVCLKNGVSNKVGFIEFFRDTETGGRRGSFKKEFVGNNFKGFTEKVQTLTLDMLIEKYGIPQFVKIDVEGFEKNVVYGLTKELSNTVFFVEVREETKKEIFEYFQNSGYFCYHIDNDKNIFIEAYDQIPSFANLIFRK